MAKHCINSKVSVAFPSDGYTRSNWAVTEVNRLSMSDPQTTGRHMSHELARTFII